MSVFHGTRSAALAVRLGLVALLACSTCATATAAAFIISEPTPPELLLRKIDTGSSTASLENTYWRLVRIGTQAVKVAPQQREPYLTLQPQQMRVTGYGGCNQMTGRYSLNGQKLTFSQVAGTMMACVHGMQEEQAFYKALTSTARWQIVGERLQLYDASGRSVAQFQSRYPK
jgi:heat shock protein HslJ